jgi:hypothetical protein
VICLYHLIGRPPPRMSVVPSKESPSSRLPKAAKDVRHFFLASTCVSRRMGLAGNAGAKMCYSVTYSVYLNSTDTRLELVNGFWTYTEKINRSSLLCLVN